MLVLLLADTRLDQLARPGLGDRRRVGAARRAHTAPGAADHRGPARLLAPARAPSNATPRPTSRPSRGLWRRLGDRVLQRPGSRWASRSPCSASSRSACSPTRRTTASAASSRRTSRASTASRCSRRSFPAGALGPTTVLVRRERGRVPAADVQAARRQVAGVAGVARVTPPLSARGTATIARFDIDLPRRPLLRRGAQARRPRCATACATCARASRRSSAPAAPCRRTSTRPRSATCG